MILQVQYKKESNKLLSLNFINQPAALMVYNFKKYIYFLVKSRILTDSWDKN